MKSSATLCFLAILFLTNSSYAQNNKSNIDSIGGIYKMLIQQSGKEKVLLQTDRKIYIAGEKIWFKAFVLNTINNKVNLSDKNLFADLVDNHDSVIAKLVLNNRQLNTSGAFTLPDSLTSGFYWIRGYTARLLAEDKGDIFIQPVYVLNKKLHDASVYNNQYARAVNKGKAPLPAIHFFPERLTGIAGIISTGVLQVMDADNNPLQVSGTLVNSRDSVVATFTTGHFGLARITFVDDPFQKYTAAIRFNGHDIKYTLPAVNLNAAQLSFANQTEKNIKAFVTLEDSLNQDFRTTILGIHGDSLCYAAVGTGIYGINIPLTNFPGGIASFLLFDKRQHLLAERKIFIDKDNYQLEVKPDKTNYAARDNARLDVSIADTNGSALSALVNVSVQDAWIEQLEDSIEINELPAMNELMINRWLARYHGKFSAADIDLIMGAMRSSYNNWASVDTGNSALPADDDEKLLNLIGRVTNGRDKAVKERVVTAISKNQSAYFLDLDSANANGAFKIPLPQNVDSLSVSLQVMDKYGTVRTDDSIKVDDFVFPVFETPAALKQQFLAGNISMIASLRKYHVDTAITFQGKGWLKPVVVTTVVKAEPNYDVSKRINNISQILTSDKFRYGGYGTIGYALLTVPGVTLYGGDLSIFGSGIMDMNGMGRPLLVVDGVGMGNAGLEYFNSLSPADVDFIEVLRGAEAGIYGSRGANGVISVNTRNGQHVMPNTRSNLRSFMPVTYHVNPQFEMPDYSNPEIKNNKLPDPRTTIYWNGNIMTDTSGKATVNFYAADNATDYSVTITGITAKGDIIYKLITISRN